MRISITTLIAAIITINAATAGSTLAPANAISPEFAKSSLQRVDEVVRKHFWDSKAVPAWENSLNANRNTILEQRTLSGLDKAINRSLQNLHASHTQFVTENDETYYFLRALFFEHDKKGAHSEPPKIDYLGAITGGGDCEPNQVRYILDGSPAVDAHLKIGDQIIAVNGAPYIGQLSLKGLAGKPVRLTIKRGGVESEHSVKLTARNDLDAYIEATKRSVKIENVSEKKIGYVHVWCGGSDRTHDAIEEALDKLQNTDGIIFDLRDGYGGNFFNDLDYFYRPPAAYPPFTTQFRNGKKFTSNMSYSKPVVCLINGGSRSGKELLAYSLKKSGRATLVGETTAGYVLAGRLFGVNSRAALYCAVSEAKVNGDVLEGKGVSPDIEIKTTCAERGQQDRQYQEALRVLREKIAGSQQSTGGAK